MSAWSDFETTAASINEDANNIITSLKTNEYLNPSFYANFNNNFHSITSTFSAHDAAYQVETFLLSGSFTGRTMFVNFVTGTTTTKSTSYNGYIRPSSGYSFTDKNTLITDNSFVNNYSLKNYALCVKRSFVSDWLNSAYPVGSIRDRLKVEIFNDEDPNNNTYMTIDEFSAEYGDKFIINARQSPGSDASIRQYYDKQPLSATILPSFEYQVPVNVKTANNEIIESFLFYTFNLGDLASLNINYGVGMTSEFSPMYYKFHFSGQYDTTMTMRALYNTNIMKLGLFSSKPFAIVNATDTSHRSIKNSNVAFAGDENEWFNYWSKIGIHCNWQASEVQNLKPSEWTTGNKTIDVSEEYKPGSGGQPGGITSESEPGSDEYPGIVINPDYPGGGHGSGDNINDEIIAGSEATGCSEMSTSYALTYGETLEMNHAFLNGDLWTNISSYFHDPQTAIINLLAFPFDILKVDTDTSHYQYYDPIQIAGIPMNWGIAGSGGSVSGYALKQGFKTRIDMGSFDFKEYFGSFLDYAPYTKITLYLPYVGYKELDPDKFMGRHLHVYYNVSFSDGSMMAVIEADAVPIYTISGSIGYHVPITHSDAADIIQQGIRNTIATLATVGMGAAAGAGQAMAAGQAGKQAASTIAMSAGSSISGSALTNTVASFTAKSHASASGPAEGKHGRAMSYIPFIIIERPVTNMPQGYQDIAGYQTNMYTALEMLSGFTVCDDVKLYDIGTATGSELDEIKLILMKGVII